MAMKTVKIESVLCEKFRIENHAGGHNVIVDQPAAAGGTDAGPTPLDSSSVARLAVRTPRVAAASGTSESRRGVCPVVE